MENNNQASIMIGNEDIQELGKKEGAVLSKRIEPIKDYQFKVGDLVKIKEWDELLKEIIPNIYGNIIIGTHMFPVEIKKYCGRIGEISNIEATGRIELKNLPEYRFLNKMLTYYGEIKGVDKGVNDAIAKVSYSTQLNDGKVTNIEKETHELSEYWKGYKKYADKIYKKYMEARIDQREYNFFNTQLGIARELSGTISTENKINTNDILQNPKPVKECVKKLQNSLTYINGKRNKTDTPILPDDLKWIDEDNDCVPKDFDHEFDKYTLDELLTVKKFLGNCGHNEKVTDIFNEIKSHIEGKAFNE